MNVTYPPISRAKKREQLADWGKQERTNIPSPSNCVCDPAAAASRSHPSCKHQVAPGLPDASLPQRYDITQDDARQCVEATCKPSNSAGEDQLVHGLCKTAEQTAKSKGGVREQKEGFGPKGGGKRAVQKL